MLVGSVAFLAVLTIGAAPPPGADARAWAELQAVLARWDRVKTLTMRQIKTERLDDGEIVVEEARVKVRRPGDIYIGNIQPKAGQEALYSAARDRAHLVAHKGSFPDVTVSLSVTGSMATERQHHLIVHTGFDYLFLQIRKGLATAVREPSGERMEFGGELTFRGRPALRLVLHSGTLPPRQVTAEKKEPLVAFAERVGCDPYLLVYANESLGALAHSVKAGETYAVPRYYGAKTELLIDRETQLPLMTSISDTQGQLYERFEYFELQVDVPLGDVDFDPENPAYDF